MIKKIDTGRLNYQGKPIMIDVVQTDPLTGLVPLCECQKAKIFAKYNASAGMQSHERSRLFNTAVIDEENYKQFSLAKNFVKNINDNLRDGAWFYIFGDADRAKKQGLSEVGTGKSYLTHCIGNELTRLNYKAIYVTEDKLFADIKSTYQRNSEESEGDVLYRYQEIPILLIDDLFKSKQTEWTEDKLFHLLNNRLGSGKVTIINSNYAPNRIESMMPKAGSAICSRIMGQAQLVEMIGTDRRRKTGGKQHG